MEHRRRRPPLRTVGMDPDLRHFPTVPRLQELCRRHPATDRIGDRERRRGQPLLQTTGMDPDLRHFPAVSRLPDLCRRFPAPDRDREHRRTSPEIIFYSLTKDRGLNP